MLRNTQLASLTLALVCVVSACAETDSPHGVDDPEPSLPVQLGVTETAVYRELATFEGYADPENGIFEIWSVTEVSQSSTSGEYVTATSPLFCGTAVGEDGNPDTNPLNTLQIFTESDSTATGPTACRALKPAGTVSDGIVSGIDRWLVTDVFCSTVTIENFHNRPVGALYAEIQQFNGLPNQVAMGAAFGGTAESVNQPGDEGPRATHGLWRYGPLESQGAGYDERSIQWQFQQGSNAYFQFSGRIVERIVEDCSNGVDDNCDGRVNEGCATFTTGADCVDHADCASGSCDSGSSECDASCSAGTYGPSCLPCPSTAQGICSGVTRGLCNDGAVGDGACTCLDGFHGATCEYSCSDGVLNGDESAQDCGGSCGTLGEICNGRDDDCDGAIDDEMACDVPVRTTGGSGYIYLPTPDTWSEQRDACRAYPGYDLMIVDSAAEWATVSDLLAVSGDAWIAANDSVSEGDFVWEPTGLAPSGYLPWASGNPSGDDCVAVSGGEWDDRMCTDLVPAVCETAPVLTDTSGTTDDDGDGIPNPGDHCSDDPANDIDQDGVCAPADNCPNTYQDSQLDSDSDGWGDACDVCPNEAVHICDAQISDLICPCTCDAATDIDCTNMCGNFLLESVEACDGDGEHAYACPRNDAACDDSDACTTDILADAGVPAEVLARDEWQQCHQRCIHIALPNTGTTGCACGDDLDCADGYECLAGVCVVLAGGCAVDGDCQDGFRCALGSCVVDDGSCIDDSDCSAGETCVAAACVVVPTVATYSGTTTLWAAGSSTDGRVYSEGHVTLGNGVSIEDGVYGNAGANLASALDIGSASNPAWTRFSDTAIIAPSSTYWGDVYVDGVVSTGAYIEMKQDLYAPPISVVLGAYSTVTGTVYCDITPTLLFGATIGAHEPGQAIPAWDPPQLPDAMSQPTGGSDITKGVGETEVLSPGSYGDVNIGSTGSLYLSSGDYGMDQLDLADNANLYLDLSSGDAINVLVAGDFTVVNDLEVLVKVPGEGTYTDVDDIGTLFDPDAARAMADQVHFHAVGTVDLDDDCDFFGNVYAKTGGATPNLNVGANNDVIGRLFADGAIDVGGSATVTIP